MFRIPRSGVQLQVASVKLRTRACSHSLRAFQGRLWTRGSRIYSTPAKLATMLPAEIISKLAKNFDKARASGDLLFYPSTVYKHEEHGVEVRILIPAYRCLVVPATPVCTRLHPGLCESPPSQHANCTRVIVCSSRFACAQLSRINPLCPPHILMVQMPRR